MADQDIPAMDYDEHARTYAGFIKLTRWAIVIAALVLTGLALLA